MMRLFLSSSTGKSSARVLKSTQGSSRADTRIDLVRWTLRVFAFLVAVFLCPVASIDISAQHKPQSVLERFLARPDDKPTEYRALRRMEAHNEHFDASAWMDVWTQA